MTFVSSELFGDSYHSHIFAISDKNGGLTRGHKNEAVIGVIDVKIGCDVEDEISTIVAIVDIKLLLLNRINLFYFKTHILAFEAVVVRIVLFLWSFWF